MGVYETAIICLLFYIATQLTIKRQILHHIKVVKFARAVEIVKKITFKKPIDFPFLICYNYKCQGEMERVRGKKPVIRLSLGVIKEPRAI